MASLSFPQHHPGAYRCAKRGVAARPTGTLYGKSAQGGIINIVTQQPEARRAAILKAASVAATVIEVIQPERPHSGWPAVRQRHPVTQVDDGDMINPATGSDDLGGTAPA